MPKKYTVHCKYCGGTQVWTFVPNTDGFRDMEDIIEWDYEYECNRCGCSVRVNEALEEADMEELGYESWRASTL